MSLGNSSGNYGILRFSDANSVLGGTNGSVVFSNLSNSVYNTLQENLAGGTLTIGPGITIHGGTGSIGYNPNIGGPSNVAVINQGTILADSAGTLTVNGTNWCNSGTIQAPAAAMLVAGRLVVQHRQVSIRRQLNCGTWSNLGDQRTSSRSTWAAVLLAWDFSRTGGTVNLTGTLNNAGTTLGAERHDGVVEPGGRHDRRAAR